MCTVVFIPTRKGCLLASLRDESPARALALPPQKYSGIHLTYLSPGDTAAGGTWVSINETNAAMVLLNGGYTNHVRKLPYLKSRGLIVAELSGSQMPVAAWSFMDLENIEPFTMVMWDNENLYELVWDGQNKHRKRMNKTIPHLWSSSTLYNETCKRVREELFEKWLAEKPAIDNNSLLSFFKSYNHKYNGFVMNRNELVKTISYTFITIEKNSRAVMNYLDLQTLCASVQSIALLPFDAPVLCTH